VCPASRLSPTPFSSASFTTPIAPISTGPQCKVKAAEMAAVASDAASDVTAAARCLASAPVDQQEPPARPAASDSRGSRRGARYGDGLPPQAAGSNAKSPIPRCQMTSKLRASPRRYETNHSGAAPRLGHQVVDEIRRERPQFLPDATAATG
jgi:hypothetical protein